MGAPIQARLARIWRRLLFRWRRDQLHRELEEELSFHLQQKDAESNGLSRAEMGNVAAELARL